MGLVKNKRGDYINVTVKKGLSFEGFKKVIQGLNIVNAEAAYKEVTGNEPREAKRPSKEDKPKRNISKGNSKV